MTDQKLIIKIQADTDKAVKEITKLNTEVGKLSKGTEKVGSSSDGIKKTTTAFSGLGKTLVAVGTGLAALGIATKAVDFAKMAADAEQSADAFNRVFDEMGLNAEEEFNKIKEASYGLIPDAAIKQSVVVAESLGLPLEKMAGLMEVARVKARVMGTDVTSAFNDLATGIGRGSPMILDNLGIIIKLEEANKKWAEANNTTVESMTKQQKQMALTNAVLEASVDTIDRYKDATLSSKEEMQKFDASVANLKVQIGNELLPIMNDLVQASTEWVNELDPESVSAFGDSLKTLATIFEGVYNSVVLLNDILMPDWLGGEGAGILGTVAEGWGKIATIVNELVYNFSELSDTLVTQEEKFVKVNEGYLKFGKSAEEVDKAIKSVKGLIAENERILAQDMAGNSKAQVDATIVLTDRTTDLNIMLANLNKDKVYLQMAKEIDGSKDSLNGLQKKTKEYTEKELAALAVANTKRIGNAQKTIATLLTDEKKLTDNIAKENQKLVVTLNKIAQSRFKTSQDLASRISQLQRTALSEDQAYYSTQEEAEKKLSEAKVALKNGEFEKYKVYISEYDSLVTASAGEEIKVGDKVAVSAEQTRTAALAGLKNIASLEDQYYTQKAQAATNANKAATANDRAELGAIKLKIAEQQILIRLLSKDTKATHTIDSNVDQVQLGIDALKKNTKSSHTITTVYKTSGTPPRVAAATGGLIPQGLAAGGAFQGSGKVPGYDASDSDKVNAMLTGGEFVVKRSAVDAYGTSLLHSINNMSLPKFASGGEVGGSSTQTALQPINLSIGGKSFKMMSDRDVAESLQRFIESEGGL